MIVNNFFFSLADDDNMAFRDDIKPQDLIEEQVFVVERLLGRRSMMRKGKRIEKETQYLVKWDGYGIHECSWCVPPPFLSIYIISRDLSLGWPTTETEW